VLGCPKQGKCRKIPYIFACIPSRSVDAMINRGSTLRRGTLVVLPAAVLAFSGLTLAGLGANSGVAHALPCSNDMTDADYCGNGGSSGGGRSPFGTGPGQVNLLPGVTQNGPIDLTPGAGTNLTPGGGTASGDLWNMINDKHVAAGCAPYGNAPALADVSLQYAHTMATNNGKLSPNTVALLQGKGYNPSAWGEMDYFNANGSPQSALDFWLANPTRDVISNCAITQMEVSVSTHNGLWAASSISATPA
jgi:hypothetical protein